MSLIKKHPKSVDELSYHFNFLCYIPKQSNFRCLIDFPFPEAIITIFSPMSFAEIRVFGNPWSFIKLVSLLSHKSFSTSGD